jgi:iron-sulfur cluster assembly accessory protein
MQEAADTVNFIVILSAAKDPPFRKTLKINGFFAQKPALGFTGLDFLPQTRAASLHEPSDTLPHQITVETKRFSARDKALASCATMELHQIPPKPAGSENKEMITVTPVATTKVKEIMGQQNPAPVALRVAVVGGGCSGFSYHMAFENAENPTDNVYEFDGLKVLVDQMSEMYLEGVSIDYIETLEGAGFKFNNPNVKSTCGCGSSFSV